MLFAPRPAQDVRATRRTVLDTFDNMFRDRHLRPSGLGVELATFVEACYRTAAEHRCSIGVQEELEYCLAAYQDRYTAQEAALIEKGRDVFLGISGLIARALQGWFQDVLLNSEDRPWTLSPTPQPQLPEWLERVVVDRLQAELESGNLSPEGLDRVLPRVRQIANAHARSIAAAATEGMQERLTDLMSEAGWRAAFDDVFVDMSIYPVAVMRGPIVRLQRRMRWQNRRLIEVEEPTVQVERASPFDAFPSPDSTTPQNGMFYIDRMHFNRKNMVDSIGMPGFDERAIRSVMVEHPRGTQWWSHYSENDEVSKASARRYEDGTHNDTFKILAFYGAVDARMLYEFGIEGIDPHTTVEAEIWVCGGRVIRAELNPRPLGRRPIDVCRFQPIPGSFWGRSLMYILRDSQRTANAAARALVGNMGIASGPIVEYDQRRLEGEDDVHDLQPWRFYGVKPDAITGANAPAMRFHQVPTIAPQLVAIYDRFKQEMHDLSGIPAFAIGSPQTSGAGRTLGGLSMLLGNAARGVKRAIASIDKDLTEPKVEALFHMEMLYGTDESIKADAQVVARGSSGLLQRQLTQNRAAEALQVMAPFVNLAKEDGTPLVPVRGLERVLADILQSLGYMQGEILDDPDRPERLGTLGAALGQGPAGIQQTPAAPPIGTPPPALDGRSAPADTNANVGLAP